MRRLGFAVLPLLVGCSGGVDGTGGGDTGIGPQGLPDSWVEFWGLDATDPDLPFEDGDADGLTNLEEFIVVGSPRPWLDELESSFPRPLPPRIDLQPDRGSACVVRRSSDEFTGLGIIRVDRRGDLERIARWMQWRPDRGEDACQEIPWPDTTLALDDEPPRVAQARMAAGGHPQYEIVTRYNSGGRPQERVSLSSFQKGEVLIVWKSVLRWQYDTEGRLVTHEGEHRAEVEVSDAAVRALHGAAIHEEGWTHYPSDLPEELRELSELGAWNFPAGGSHEIVLERSEARYDHAGVDVTGVSREWTDLNRPDPFTERRRTGFVFDTDGQVLAIERYRTYYLGDEVGRVELPVHRPYDHSWCDLGDAWLTELERDASGRLVAATSYDENSQVCASVAFEYDDGGRVVGRRNLEDAPAEPSPLVTYRSGDPLPGPGDFAAAL